MAWRQGAKRVAPVLLLALVLSTPLSPLLAAASSADAAGLQARAAAYIYMLRALLGRLGLLNATASQIADQLGVPLSVAEKAITYANMPVSKLSEMDSASLRMLVEDLASTYRRLVSALPMPSGSGPGALASVASVRIRTLERLALLAEKVAKRINDSELLVEASKLRKALREGDVEAAEKAALKVVELLRANNMYMLSLTLNRALARVLEEMSRSSGGFADKHLRLLEKIRADIERATRLLAVSSVGTNTSVVAPRLVAALATLSDANETASLAVENPSAALAAWAARLEARLEDLREALSSRPNMSAKALPAPFTGIAERLVDRAAKLLAEAEKALEEGDTGKAARLLAAAQALIAKVEALLARTGPGRFADVIAELRIRHMMPELITPIIGKLGALGTNATRLLAEKLVEKAEEAVEKAHRAVAEAEKYANTSSGAKLYARAVKALERAEEALNDARSLLAEGSYGKAIARAREAIAYAGKAYSLARAAIVAGRLEEARGISRIIGATMPANASAVEEAIRSLEERLRQLSENLSSLNTSIPGLEKTLDTIRAMVNDARKLVEQGNVEAARRIVKKAEERLALVEERVALATNASYVSKAIERAAEQAQQLLSLIEEAAKAINATNSTAAATLVEAKGLAERALKLVEEAKQAASQGNVSLALRLLAQARALLQQARSTAAKAVQGAAAAEAVELRARKLLGYVKSLREAASVLEEVGYSKLAEKLRKAALEANNTIAEALALIRSAQNDSLAQAEAAAKASLLLDQAHRELSKAAQSLSTLGLQLPRILADYAGKLATRISKILGEIKELRKQHQDNTTVLEKLEKAEQLLEEALQLSKARIRLRPGALSPWKLVEALASLARAKQMLEKAEQLLEEA